MSLEAVNVSYVYPDGTIALKNVSLRISSGEFVGILGQNGSGKTTLAKCLAGLLKPSSGYVLVNGKDISRFRKAELVSVVGYISQNVDTQLLNVKVREELRFTPKVLGLPDHEIERRVKEALRKVGLNEEILSKDTVTLPKHLKLRVLLASILTAKPKVLIVDEPTTGQDWFNSLEFVNVLRRLNEEGTTVVLISHDIELIAMTTSKIVVMDLGRIVVEGPSKEVLSNVDLMTNLRLKPTQAAIVSHRLKDLLGSDKVVLVEELISVLKERFKTYSKL